MLLFGFFACVLKDHCFLVTYYYILALPKTNDLNLNWMSYIFFLSWPTLRGESENHQNGIGSVKPLVPLVKLNSSWITLTIGGLTLVVRVRASRHKVVRTVTNLETTWASCFNSLRGLARIHCHTVSQLPFTPLTINISRGTKPSNFSWRVGWNHKQ